MQMTYLTNRGYRDSLIERFAIYTATGYCLFCARDLGSAWTDAPLEQWSGLAFGLWALPIGLACARMPKVLPVRKWLIEAVVLASLSGMLQMNTLAHVALAIALTAWLPLRARTCAAGAFWVASAISWMPSAGWLFPQLTGTIGTIARVFLAAVSASALLINDSRSPLEERPR